MIATIPSQAAQRGSWRFSHLRFESRAVLDGSQTQPRNSSVTLPFESRAILDGSQTEDNGYTNERRFESRAVLDNVPFSRPPRRIFGAHLAHNGIKQAPKCHDDIVLFPVVFMHNTA